jgi:nicotinate phosphoribosyltransferase
MNVTVLVDFDNNSADTAVRVANALEGKLWGIRLDTGGNMVDDGLLAHSEFGSFNPLGVNPQLVRYVRDYLNTAGHSDVKIIVSGGFKAEKIREFERLGVPVDAYGVGSSLIRGSNDYTADIVEPVAKVGRWKRDDSRLEVVT